LLLDVYATFKALVTSYDCERDNPNLALFKYDKNKSQRLSYLADIDMKTGKRAEWCIRNFSDGTIQVDVLCSPFEYVGETYFREAI
jgi:hypothetical protein